MSLRLCLERKGVVQVLKRGWCARLQVFVAVQQQHRRNDPVQPQHVDGLEVGTASGLL